MKEPEEDGPYPGYTWPAGRDPKVFIPDPTE